MMKLHKFLPFTSEEGQYNTKRHGFFLSFVSSVFREEISGAVNCRLLRSKCTRQTEPRSGARRFVWNRIKVVLEFNPASRWLVPSTSVYIIFFFFFLSATPTRPPSSRTSLQQCGHKLKGNTSKQLDRQRGHRRLRDRVKFIYLLQPPVGSFFFFNLLHLLMFRRLCGKLNRANIRSLTQLHGP